MATSNGSSSGAGLVRDEVLERYREAPRKPTTRTTVDPERFRPLRWPVLAAAAVIAILLVTGFAVHVPIETQAMVTSSSGPEVTVMTTSAHQLEPGSTVTVSAESADSQQARASASVTAVPEVNAAVLEVEGIDLTQSQAVTIQAGSTPILLAIIEG